MRLGPPRRRRRRRPPPWLRSTDQRPSPRRPTLRSDNLFRPILAEAAPHLTLETKAYDVVGAREYPSERALETVDCVLVTGSFEDDSVADETWILRLAGFLIQINDCFPRIRIIVCRPLLAALAALSRARAVVRSQEG